MFREGMLRKFPSAPGAPAGATGGAPPATMTPRRPSGDWREALGVKGCSGCTGCGITPGNAPAAGAPATVAGADFATLKVRLVVMWPFLTVTSFFSTLM